MDFLDILEGRGMTTYSGTYYDTLPNHTTERTDDGGMDFDYEIITPTAHTQTRLFGNVMERSAGTLTIRSHDDIEWKIGKFVVLQDDKLYSIIGAEEDMTRASKDAARFSQIPMGSEHIIRLLEQSNPFGIV